MPKSNDPLAYLFTESSIVKKIKQKLPKLFAIAELESSRGGKIGMQVGSLREDMLVALLISVFGENNVKTDFPITESEIDVEVKGSPVSIKTITGLNGIKAIWTVDAQKARAFANSFEPSCDILLAVICWNDARTKSGLFLIPKSVQDKVFKKLGKGGYLKLPEEGTNPRGVEISKEAVVRLTGDKDTLHLGIAWIKERVDFKPYKRWLDFWNEK